MSLIQVMKIDKRGLDCVNSLLGTLVQSILQYLEMKRTQLWCWHGEKMYQVSLQPFISEECHWGWGTPTTWCTGTAWRRRKAGRSWAWIRRLWDLSRRKDVQPTSASRVPCVEVRHQTTSILEVFWSFFFHLHHLIRQDSAATPAGPSSGGPPHAPSPPSGAGLAGMTVSSPVG